MVREARTLTATPRRSGNSPSPPFEGGEGRGEEGRLSIPRWRHTLRTHQNPLLSHIRMAGADGPITLRAQLIAGSPANRAGERLAPEEGKFAMTHHLRS